MIDLLGGHVSMMLDVVMTSQPHIKSGKIRGINLQGNDALRPLFEKWLEPFHDLGAKTIVLRNTGGTDHLSFDAVGLPGFQFIQDPLDYFTRTHHSNMDVYDRIQADDLKQASAIIGM